jgi:hypothetical protein
MIKEIVKIELKNLNESLKSGDEIIVSGSYDKPIRYSKKVGDARVSFINLIQGLLKSDSITVEEANWGTREFGKKTTKLYWQK